MIEVKGVTKIYKKGNNIFTALNNISIKLEKGDFCTVTGPSGAGKSTLLYIIGGLTHPDSGNLIFNGRDIYSQSRMGINRYRKEHLGFMFQQFHLMPYLTVIDNIRLACHDKLRSGYIDYYLEKCSLTEMRYKYPSELSTGEKQRAAFIRAIISNPELLLADEPTGSLDPANSLTLMSLIKDYHKNNGTVVLISHDPSFSDYANQKVTLEKGVQIVLPASRVSP
jgi:ABC-type lipoprotein export system ATPase subunit